jgi:hypothetical protein
LDHFGVVEVPDVQKDRDQKTYGRTVDLKCDTNLLIPLASRIDLDACHCDLKFAHPVARGPWVALIGRCSTHMGTIAPISDISSKTSARPRDGQSGSIEREAFPPLREKTEAPTEAVPYKSLL